MKVIKLLFILLLLNVGFCAFAADLPDDEAFTFDQEQLFDEEMQQQDSAVQQQDTEAEQKVSEEQTQTALDPVENKGYEQTQKKSEWKSGYLNPPKTVDPRERSFSISHPDAAKGLIKIKRDGSYVYKVPRREKSQAMSVRVGTFAPPTIASSRGVTFGTMYGKGDLMALLGDYEWQPFRGFGALGLQLGYGFTSVHGKGVLASGQQASESYDLYVFPMSAFLVYRFEYMRSQWLVPYVNGGYTGYGMIEKRDDDTPAVFGLGSAVGGGGGVHFNISRWDHEGSFILDRDYGIAEMWFTVEARVMKGLSTSLDFSNSTISAGITVDY